MTSLLQYEDILLNTQYPLCCLPDDIPGDIPLMTCDIAWWHFIDAFHWDIPQTPGDIPLMTILCESLSMPSISFPCWWSPRCFQYLLSLLWNSINLYNKWLYCNNSLNVFKFSISLLVLSDFKRKKVAEINSPYSCSVYSITLLPISLLISPITFLDAGQLIISVFWLGDFWTKSDFNPLTVSIVILSYIIFSHSWILLEIQSPLNALILFLKFAFNFCKK